MDPINENWPDVARFIQELKSPGTRTAGLRDPKLPAVLTRAPGRLDVMGGIADYSGSLVLQLPLREATCVALQRVSERELTLVTLGGQRDDADAVFTEEIRKKLKRYKKMSIFIISSRRRFKRD